MMVRVDGSLCSNTFYLFHSFAVSSFHLKIKYSLIIRLAVCLLLYDMALMVSADKELGPNVNIRFDFAVSALINCAARHDSSFSFYFISIFRCRKRVMWKRA